MSTTSTATGTGGGKSAGAGSPPTSGTAPKAPALPTWAIVLISGLVLVAIVLTTLILAFHYQKASDTTSVLGVAIPALTTVIGAALGVGVGAAAGSSGKQAVQQQLSSTQDTLSKTQSKVQQAHDVVTGLDPELKEVLGWLQTQSNSEAGSNMLTVNVAGRPDPQPTLNSSLLDDVNTSIGRLHGLLGPEVPPTDSAPGQ